MIPARYKVHFYRLFLPVAALFTMGSGGQSLQVTIANIIRVTLSLFGLVAIATLFIASFHWNLACNDAVRKKAKRLVGNSMLALVIIIFLFAVSKFVVERLTTAVVAY